MVRRTALLTVVLFVLTACAALAEPVTLAYKFTKGELDKYRMNVSMDMTMPSLPGMGGMGPMSVTMQMTCQQRTLDVLPDGSGRVRATYAVSNLKTTGGGKLKGTPGLANETFSVVLTMAPDGRVSNVEGMETASGTAGMRGADVNRFTSMTGQHVLLPSKPVEIGENWDQVVPLPMGTGNMRVDSILQSYGELVWSQPTAKISQKYSAHIDMAQVMQSVLGSAQLGEKDRQALAQISGGMDLIGSMDFCFAPGIGKMLKGSGNVGGTLTITMPSDAIKAGAPAEVTMDVNVKMNLTRFK